MSHEFTLERLCREFQDRLSVDARNSPAAVRQSTLVFVCGLSAMLNLWQEMADAGLSDEECQKVAHELADNIDAFFEQAGGVPLQ